jgi:DNA-binding NtrC family response regulator
MTENIRVLVVDDEVNSTKLLKKVLTKKGYLVDEENNSVKAEEMIKTGSYDIVVSDLQMPDLTGMDLLKSKPAETLFIMITGYGSIDTAVDSMKQGAFDYIIKPFNIDEFSIKVDKAVEKVKLTAQLKNLRAQVEGSYSFSNIIAQSKKMQNVFTLIQKVSNANINILIEGDSGTGKELVSRAIHFSSDRKSFPFVAINCSAIPENLLESELFGHTKGAFTGAVEQQKGVFEQANGGTLLLDEIAEMPYLLQSKLLRVIETLEVKALGSDRVKKVDIRLISATNQNLAELVKEKKFREDLFYRISHVVISIPPLNERREDIPLLAVHFLKKISASYNRNFTITPEGLDLITKNDWKGNVRELESAIGRAAITSDNDKLDVKDFKFLNPAAQDTNPLNALDNLNLKDIEKLYIKKTLEENKWNKLQVAKILGIDRKTLYKKIREYNLE